MAEIFKEAQVFNNHPDRWNHDLTHKIYGSFRMGKLYPVMSQFMMPTDTAKLDIASLLQFMPTATPLQSNVRVIFHTFFQRMKNIVKSWPNYIEQLEDHTMPFIKPSIKELCPGSLHDYLDVPVVSVQHGSRRFKRAFSFSRNALHSQGYLSLLRFINGAQGGFLNYYFIDYSSPFSYVASSSSDLSPYYYFGLYDFGSRVVPDDGGDGLINFRFDYVPFKSASGSDGSWPIPLAVVVYVNDTPSCFRPDYAYSDLNAKMIGVSSFSASYPEAPFVVRVSSSLVVNALEELGFDPSTQYYHLDLMFGYPPSTVLPLDEGITLSYDTSEYPSSPYVVKGGVSVQYYFNNSYSISDFPELCPFATKEFPNAPIKLKAYRHRVYESIYNAFYRNINGNQPFIIDGVTQYNKYNTTTEDGLDETPYDFFNRNYELDAYTSCLPSPQQGNPPLVGISATGRLTVQDDDGTRSTAQLEDLPNGQQGLAISQIDIQNDTHRNIIMSLASSGFTINDLREANALQKFLETNIRKGFRYIDFIMGHFGKAPKHAEMDMPEFVGGTSIRLDVSKVTNTNAAADVANADNVLGQFAGAAQAFGSSKHSMQYYADDYGYLMTIMCIVPDTCYSQILPKDYLYDQPLDFPFPEFSNLGYQPITYEEFCPVEAYKDYLNDNTKLLTDVFGYQRPQHELVWKPDTLHGQFLTTMNNYAIARFFDGRPELGNEFLTIKPEETQNVFTVTKADNDIAFGQIGFSLTMKRPVPRISLPSIGR